MASGKPLALMTDAELVAEARALRGEMGLEIPTALMTDAELLAVLAALKRDVASNGQKLLRDAAEIQDGINVSTGFERCVRFYGVPTQMECEGNQIRGYATLWGIPDMHKDIVEPAAFSKSLLNYRAEGTRPLMLWQHIAAEVIGVWEELVEDSKGLFVSGRLLTSVRRGAEAAELIAAGAINGLSIGFDVLRATPRDATTHIRSLQELHLKETSLVSFPCLTAAQLTRSQ